MGRLRLNESDIFSVKINLKSSLWRRNNTSNKLHFHMDRIMIRNLSHLEYLLSTLRLIPILSYKNILNIFFNYYCVFHVLRICLWKRKIKNEKFKDRRKLFLWLIIHDKTEVDKWVDNRMKPQCWNVKNDENVFF